MRNYHLIDDVHCIEFEKEFWLENNANHLRILFAERDGSTR